MREKILNIIRKNLNKRICEKDKIIDSNIDSIIMITLLVELEKEFNFEVDDENLDYNKYEKFSDIIDMVEKNGHIQKA